jgi:recyclin-1
MRAYQPPALSDSVSDTEKPAPASTSVAPLVQFFELVHIGDMIQSIVQVYFNKELVRRASLCFTNIDVQPARCFRDRPPTLM